MDRNAYRNETWDRYIPCLCIGPGLYLWSVFIKCVFVYFIGKMEARNAILEAFVLVAPEFKIPSEISREGFVFLVTERQLCLVVEDPGSLPVLMPLPFLFCLWERRQSTMFSSEKMFSEQHNPTQGRNLLSGNHIDSIIEEMVRFLDVVFPTSCQ